MNPIVEKQRGKRKSKSNVEESVDIPANSKGRSFECAGAALFRRKISELGYQGRFSIFQTSPVRVTTYALCPMIWNELGRSRPVTTGVKTPSSPAFMSMPVFGSAGEPGKVSLQ